MKKTNRLIVGSAFGLAAIAVAIDHTHHRLPDPIPASQELTDMGDEDESPCGMGMSSSPCSMENGSMESEYMEDDDSSPCGLGD